MFRDTLMPKHFLDILHEFLMQGFKLWTFYCDIFVDILL